MKLPVERHTFTFARLPRHFDGVTIAVVSDLHVGFLWRKEEIVRRLVGAVNRLTPDLVLLLGDLVHWHRRSPRYFPLLGDLRARLGLWACLGNHEHGRMWYSRWVPPRGVPTREEWRERFAASGIALLVNEAAAIEADGERMWIVGVDDPYSRFDDLDAAMAQVPEDEFRLLMAHSPDVVDHARIHQVDLVLAGHTHGGLIHLPGMGAIHSPCRDPRRRAAGRVEVNNTLLYVTRGVGEALPLRVRCPRELTLLTLKRGTPD